MFSITAFTNNAAISLNKRRKSRGYRSGTSFSSTSGLSNMEQRTISSHSYIILLWISVFLNFSYTSASDIDWLFQKSTNFTQSPILSHQLAQNEEKIYNMLQSYSSWLLRNDELDPS